jgi:hypothetical protein
MKILLSILMFCLALGATAQINILKVASTKANALLIGSSLNKDEVVKGLKEALVLGADNAIKSASAKDGFYTNKAIRIPFPTEAEKMKTTLQKAGMQSQITAFEKCIYNRGPGPSLHFFILCFFLQMKTIHFMAFQAIFHPISDFYF